MVDKLGLLGLTVTTLAMPAIPCLAQQAPPPAVSQHPQEDDPPWIIIVETGKERSSSGQPLPEFKAPSAVTIVSGDELRNSGARMLTDALRQVPGIEVQRVSASESNITMRGYNDAADSAQGILGLLDGRQVYNDFFGNVLWDALPVDVDDVRQVEVVRGPGSFLHGSNAMHGLVNIITRSPLEYKDDHTSLRTSLGSYGAARAHLTSVRSDGHEGFKTTWSWDSVDEFEDRGYSALDSLAGEVRYAVVTGGGGNKEDKDTRGVLDLTVGASQHDFGLLIEFEDDLHNYYPSRLRNHATELYAKAVWYNEDLRTQLAWTGFDSRTQADVLVQPFTLDLDTVDLDLQYSLLGDEKDVHELTIGAGYRFSTFVTSAADVARGRHATNLSWAFAQERATLAEDLELFAGVRCDHHSITGTTLSPRVALVWQFDKVESEGKAEGKRGDAAARAVPEQGQSLRASYGEGFRNPSLRELWFYMPAAGYPTTVLGNRDLDPEHMRSLELAYSAQGSGWKASLGTYYNFVSDLIDFVPQTPILRPQNVRDEETYGFEVTGEYDVSESWSAFANYASSTRNRGDTRISLAPRHKVNAGVRLSHLDDDGSGQSGMLWIHFFDDTALSGTKMPQYTLLNAHFEHRFPVHGAVGKVFVDGFNLLNDRHQEHPFGDRYGVTFAVGVGIEW